MIELLKQAYKESGLSMKALSERSGTSYASVHAVFTGNRDPQLSTVEKLSKVLGLSLVKQKKRK